MYYIGIDLAWTYKNETGVSVFKDQTCIFCDAKVYSDERLVEIIMRYQPCIVSIDAPLVVKNETKGRTVDSLVMKTAINSRYLKLYATSRSYMLRVFNAIRGENLLAMTGMTLGTDILETYPTGIFLSLFPEQYESRYKISSRLPLDELVSNSQSLIHQMHKLGFVFELHYLGTTKKAYKLFEDKLDSILCAINSYYYHHGKSLVFEDESGMITLPTNYDKQLS